MFEKVNVNGKFFKFHSRLIISFNVIFWDSVCYHSSHLHGHVINKADPTGGMLQEEVAALFDRLAPLEDVAVVPEVLGLEVLVHGQVDGVVGALLHHPLLRVRVPSGALLHILRDGSLRPAFTIFVRVQKMLLGAQS